MLDVYLEIERPADFGLSVEPISDIDLSIETVPDMDMVLDMPFLDAGGVPYDGSYEVVPTSQPQSLATAQRRLDKNVEVSGIPYFMAGNEAGGYTVSIAS